MATTCVQIIPAEKGDASVLSQIALAAKAHWGYPARWLAEWREDLKISSEFIAQNPTFKAINFGGEILGFHALKKRAEVWWLEHLWVSPEQIGRGYGRALLQHAANLVRSQGAPCLTIESDPHAEGFYLRMGARRIGTVTRKIDGQTRALPLLVRDLFA